MTRQPIVLGGHRQQCAGPLAKLSCTAPGAHSVQLALKPPSALALHWHLARDQMIGIYAHSVTIGSTKQSNTHTPKKNTVVLAASLRSALRIRCWCCTTALCLCYLRWCRQHHILMLFQDNGTRLRRACRLRQISQDSMHTSRRLPGPRTRGGSGVNPLSSYPFKADPLGNNSSRCLWAGIISVSSG